MSTPAGSSSGKRFLVTAEHERIDAVRDWGNIFTGNTGLAIGGRSPGSARWSC